jgi:hypothetical protein
MPCCSGETHTVALARIINLDTIEYLALSKNSLARSRFPLAVFYIKLSAAHPFHRKWLALVSDTPKNGENFCVLSLLFFNQHRSKSTHTHSTAQSSLSVVKCSITGECCALCSTHLPSRPLVIIYSVINDTLRQSSIREWQMSPRTLESVQCVRTY